LAIVLFACNYSQGVLREDANIAVADGVADGAGDATSGRSCYPQWLDHSIRFQAAVPLSINTTAYERDPFLTPDERTLYFSSDRAGSMSYDVWVATRNAITDAFSNPMRATEVDSSGGESKLSITQNGLTAVVGSDRTGSLGGIDVWESTRVSTNGPFPPMSRTRVMNIETSANDHDPTISADGLRIYLAPDGGYQHIVVAARATTTDNFGSPTTIGELDSGTGDGDPSPSPDERVILFTSNRYVTGLGTSNIFYATRATATGTFDAPLPVPDVNTDTYEGDPHLSSDGCRIYFARYAGTGIDWDLYVATAN
jgi:Tol biopolymer transport system component